MRKPVYIPKALSKPFDKSLLLMSLAEFATLILMWGTLLAVAVFARAIVGV